ncbi:MAG: 1-acyl-sn-glycerol-3-phosphate acyltransferase [Candidatus Thermoplasmatota archaeon]
MRPPDPTSIEKAAEVLRRLRQYSRLTVEGIEHVPAGPCILVANHTGWAGLDYANLFITVYDGIHRAPRVAVHPSFFRVPALRDLGERLGFFEVSVQTSAQILDEKGIVTFFPEAENGNFKPFWKRYQLQEFKPGFARVALATEAPIVPVVIVGGEDANPSLGKLHIKHDLGNIPVPLPLNLFPLPVKWRISFMEPIDPARYLNDESPDKDHAETIARDVRAAMQEELDRQVAKRGNPWL